MVRGASPPWLPRSPFLAFTTRSLEKMTIRGLFLSSLIPWLHHSTSEYNHPWWYHAVRSVDRSFRNAIAQVQNSMTILGRHLQIRCITKLVSSPTPALAFRYSVNGSAVVYLFLRNTKLVFTWCTALHGIMCSRSSFSYARMLLQAIFK